MQQGGDCERAGECFTRGTSAAIDAQELVNDMAALASLGLQDLSTDLLQSITRTAGRPSRVLSKPFKAAYGPLTCGLALNTQEDVEAIKRMYSLDPSRFLDISSVKLGTHPGSCIDSIAGVFPKLQSLDLQHPSYTGSLGPLASLGSCLTSLSVSPPSNAAHDLMPGIKLLSSLRKLVLVVPDDSQGAFRTVEVTGLHHVSSLSRLQHFELRLQNERAYRDIDDVSWLTSLLTLQLTTLLLQPFVWGWDQAASETLGGLSQLRTLQLMVEDVCHDDFENAAEAIAELTALTCLSIGLFSAGSGAQEESVLSWSALQLSSLTMPVCIQESQCVSWVLEAMAVQQTLTQLRITHPSCLPEGAAAVYGAGLSSLARLSRLEGLELQCYYESAYEFFRAVAQLTRLTSLMLQNPWNVTHGDIHSYIPSYVTLPDPQLEWNWPVVVEPVTALRSLRVLDVGMHCDGLPKALLHCLPCFPCMRELYLSGGGGGLHTPTIGGRVTEEDLQQLGVLRGTLTALKLSGIMGMDGPCEAAAQQLPWLRDLLV